MPEPVNIDLTARVAAEERARRADLAPDERSIDILSSTQIIPICTAADMP